MAHCIAIIEDAGPGHAVGVWFPDLPGCTELKADPEVAEDLGANMIALIELRLPAHATE